jgi:predicted nucleic acid-binding protein
MKYYADTSFLASLYITGDAHNALATRILEGWQTAPRLPLTPFGMIELLNVLSRLQFKGKMHAAEALVSETLVRQDLATGVLETMPLRAYEWMRAAQDIARNITPLTGTRTLDVLHLAIARLNGAKTILSFDKNQRLAAKAAGFALLPVSI